MCVCLCVSGWEKGVIIDLFFSVVRIWITFSFLGASFLAGILTRWSGHFVILCCFYVQVCHLRSTPVVIDLLLFFFMKLLKLEMRIPWIAMRNSWIPWTFSESLKELTIKIEIMFRHFWAVVRDRYSRLLFIRRPSPGYHFQTWVLHLLENSHVP